MNIIFSFLLFLFLLPGFSFSQNKTNCNSPEAKEFDFWIGEWELEWENPDGKIAKGSNTIKKLFDDCVIEENFNGESSIKLRGKSLSVFNDKTGKWHQTWVDNNGSYLDFTGGKVDEKMILSRSFKNSEGKQIYQRMVFYNIKENEFDWKWEKSFDKGKTWEVRWEIHYKRIK